MTRIDYECPKCGTTNVIHERFCKYAELHPVAFEVVYIDILSTLSILNGLMTAYDAPPGVRFSHLTRRVSEQKDEGEWHELYTDVLHSLKNRRYVVEREEAGGLYLRKPEERQQEIIPTFEPLQTVYEYGPVDGAKDYAVYTMISWCELVGLSWPQTREFVREWLTETNAWDELRWGERSIDELLDAKQHIYDRGLGWGDYADIAKNRIEASDRERGIDARQKVEEASIDDYDTDSDGTSTAVEETDGGANE